MSFIHKSIWVQFLITLFIGYHYIDSFYYLFESGQLTDDKYTELLLFTAFQMIVLQIAVHTIVAIFSNKEEVELEKDERDVIISLKGGNVAYNTLSTWVVILLVQIWLTTLPNARFFFDTLSGEYNLLNFLLVGFLMAELLRFGTALYHYQKGV